MQLTFHSTEVSDDKSAIILFTSFAQLINHVQGLFNRSMLLERSDLLHRKRRVATSFEEKSFPKNFLILWNGKFD